MKTSAALGLAFLLIFVSFAASQTAEDDMITKLPLIVNLPLLLFLFCQLACLSVLAGSELFWKLLKKFALTAQDGPIIGQYSGYLQVDTNLMFHYWFVEVRILSCCSL